LVLELKDTPEVKHPIETALESFEKLESLLA
jgi:hypothetical protein